MKSIDLNKYLKINNERILQLMAAIETKTKKMFHEYDSVFEQVCIDALDSKDASPKIRAIAILSNRLDRLEEES